MLSPMISTKLHIPQATSDLVPRPHLIQALDAALERPQRLILVSAPAGFGKTTLVAEWLRHSGMPAAWLSIDRDDNDPTRFWRYVVAALQTVNPDFGRSVQGACDSQPVPPLKALVASLVNDLDGATRPFLLILDDYHLIETDAIHSSLNSLLDHLPSALRIVITTRADPPLALSRLRSRNQVTEARTADLRFTRDEAAAFLNRIHRLDLPEEDISFLENRTEGWIAGLQLAALSLHRQSDRHAFVTAFAGDDRYIVDYLLQEVLQQQPPPVRSFLLQTSILDRLCAPLCEAVTGMPDPEGMLRQLEAANLFILPLDNRRYWYRYHMLFADLLRHRLDQEIRPADRLDLYRRAGKWLEREGYIFEAISQALAAPDYSLAADLLERHALSFFFRSESSLLRGWLKSLPEDLLSSRALLCAVYAHTIAHTGVHRPSVMRSTEYWFKQADRSLQSTAAGPASQGANPEYRELTRNFIALSRVWLALWRNEKPQTVIALAQEALAGLPPADEVPADSNFLRFRSGLIFNLGMNYIFVGDDAAADRAFAEARKIGEASGDLLNAYAAASGQCYILRRKGRLQEAATLCHEALESIDPSSGQPSSARVPFSGNAYVDLGLILMEWNDLQAAEESILRGLELLQMGTNIYKQAEGHVTLADIRLIRGENAATSRLLQAEKSMPEIKLYAPVHYIRSWLRQGALDAAVCWAKGRRLEDGQDLESLALARVILACNPPLPMRKKSGDLPDLASLRQFLDRQLQNAESIGWIDRMIELLMLQALAWRSEYNSEKAVTTLRRALALSREGGYVRRFIDEGAPMLELLKTMEGKNGELNPYIGRLLAAGTSGEARPAALVPQTLIEPLSSRELEVLRLIALGDSNAEIAKKLVITLNTTKKHITHIFEKLEVTNRSKAAIRARELGLVAWNSGMENRIGLTTLNL